ncbi:hypothetical protein T492DRAFT_884471 [Pavlovales sp. CCMP2436]|nr:hypothetical protein T492DRAFT_884471 [Pavlovales sp. CCMP2436]
MPTGAYASAAVAAVAAVAAAAAADRAHAPKWTLAGRGTQACDKNLVNTTLRHASGTAVHISTFSLSLIKATNKYEVH